MKTLLLKKGEIGQAILLLKNGELVAFPTETVYGLGALALNEEAIRQIFVVKGRPSDNPLIVHVASLSQVEELVETIPESFFLLAEAFWPGPLTMILRKKSHVPAIISGGGDTIALRMPSHPIARKLIEACGPLVAPSANLSGRPSSTRASHVMEDLDGKIAAVIEGECSMGIESTVISLLDEPALLRPGSITKEEIESHLGYPLNRSSAPISPGMKYRHYAPTADVQLFNSEEEYAEHVLRYPKRSRMKAIPTQATLYALLREADEHHLDEICFICDHTVQNDEALMNRLRKAASKV